MSKAAKEPNAEAQLVLMLKKQIEAMEKQNKELRKELDDWRQGDKGADQQIKQLNEMHASKIKTLLKSINNLKKEVQQAKFEQKDNVRI